MKLSTQLSYPKILIVLPLLLVYCICMSQETNSSADKETKAKKKGFWKELGQSIVADMQKEGAGAQTNTSNSLSSGNNVIENEWLEYGAGGTPAGTFKLNFAEPSPRNHLYYFEVTQANSKIEFDHQSTVPSGLAIDIVSEYNGYVQRYLKSYTFAEPGIYKLQVAPRWRYEKGKYRINVSGPVKNIRQEKYPRWVSPKTDFGPEGSGGGGSNQFSSRNNEYLFSVEEGNVIDINLESSGEPVELAIVDEYGNIIQGRKSRNRHLEFIEHKVDKTGKYRLFVGTEKNGGKGTYTLDITGKIASEPILDPRKFQTQTGQFSKNSMKHEYKITTENTIIEMIFRSTSAKINKPYLKDPYGNKVDPHFEYIPTQQYANLSFLIKNPGDYSLILEGVETGSAPYELLLWGNVKNLVEMHANTPRSVQTPKVGSQKQQPTTNGNLPNGTADLKTVQLYGHIATDVQGISYTEMKIIVEDLSNGDIISEINPDENGNYVIIVERRKNYGVTAVTSDNSLVITSTNIDSSMIAKGSSVKLKNIEALKLQEGTTFSLNNIFFQTGNAVLLRASYYELKRIASILRTNPSLHVEIAGHTDNVGGAGINKTLSQDRANAVLFYLQDQAPAAKHLQAKGYGSDKPVASNSSDSGKQQNRRVEFRIVGD